MNKYVGSPCSLAKFTQPTSYVADDAHRPPLHGLLLSRAMSLGQTHRQTNRRTRHRFNTLAAYTVRVTKGAWVSFPPLFGLRNGKKLID